MKKVILNGQWKLFEAEIQTDTTQFITELDVKSEGWLPVSVPGDVNDTLIKNGKMPDPRNDTQGRECYWVTSKEWWYRLEFDMSYTVKDNADLCMTNVDGCTEIWLNGEKLGETNNAFRLYRFNLMALLKEQKNILAVRFKSIDQLLGGPRLGELIGWKGRRAYIRKPQFSFGWDWSLPIPSIGLSGDVWIEIENECKLNNISIHPFISGRVDFEFEVSKVAKENGYKIILDIAGHNSDIHQEIIRDAYLSYISVTIEEPKLWFPNGFGEQPLYDYKCDLMVNGSITDSHAGKFGFRESRIVEEPFTNDAGPGFSFWLEINGMKIFCKGGNWIPLEIWPGIIQPEQYEFYLKLAKEANFNIIRIWGGGIYEKDIFYNLCDELGIMVWEDFMFASAGYPVDILRDEIIMEADYQIRRLRNHPSIVIWCGTNEDVHSWSFQDNNEKHKENQNDNGVYSETDIQWEVNRLKDDPQIYSMILRGLVNKLGLGVPYIESSPQSKDDFGNIPNSGNSHISCWKFALFNSDCKPERFREHFETVCSFNSEFCIQGPCSEKTFRKFFSPSNCWPPNDAWLYHIQSGHANLPHFEQTIFIAGAFFGEINSLQKYVKYGQATHLEMMRSEFESARRDYPNNGGAMMWMYNDCWPTANWSIIDYYRNPKPSYYAAKRACASLLPIIFERCGKIEFLFSNQTPGDVSVKLVYGSKSLKGNTVWEKERVITINTGKSFIFDSILSIKHEILTEDFMFIDAVVDKEKLPRTIYFANRWKHINWQEPKIEFRLIDRKFEDGVYMTHIRLSTNIFVRLLHLIYPCNYREVRFSDNYFDLASDTEHDVNIRSTFDLDLSNLKVGNWLTDWE